MSQSSKWLDKVELMHNRLSDMPFVWFPFIFLMPHITEKISVKRTIFMSFCFAGYFAAMASVRYTWSAQQFSWQQLGSDFLIFLSCFFLWFNLVTKFFWNRRAIKL